MKDFLIQKHNVAVSAYITDLSPAAITTNGALTIIDNSNPSQPISGLTPNSRSIFLDNIFLASGYGFISYNQFETASYIINSYSNAYEYILNELTALHTQSFNIEYSYQGTENSLDKEYNSYGWLKQYKKLSVERTNETTHTIKLEAVTSKYIDDISIDVIGVNENNYADVSQEVELLIKFHKDDNITPNSKYLENAPNVYLNNTAISFDIDNENDSSLIVANVNMSAPNTYDNKDLVISCKRNNELVYEHNFGTIKWRYKIIPFNTSNVNVLLSNLDLIKLLDTCKFSDTDFDITKILTDSNKSKFSSIINNYNDYAVYIDNDTEIEFTGEGYIVDNLHCFSYDYFIIKSDIVKFDFLFNGIKNNNWSFIEFSINGNDKYRLYQSPQKYIGTHTWTFNYRNE